MVLELKQDELSVKYGMNLINHLQKEPRINMGTKEKQL